MASGAQNIIPDRCEGLVLSPHVGGVALTSEVDGEASEADFDFGGRLRGVVVDGVVSLEYEGVQVERQTEDHVGLPVR